LLWHPDCAASVLQYRRIGGLVLINGMRQWHENGRPTDRRKLRDCRCSGTGDDEMRTGDTLGKIGEKGGHFGSNPSSPITLLDSCQIFLARLLHNRKAPPQILVQERNGWWHDICHDASPLTAAKYQESQRTRRFRCDVGPGGDRNNVRAHRIASSRALAFEFCVIFKHPGKADGNCGDATRQESVGATHHCILLMDHSRNIAQRRCRDRRYRRITTKADYCGWLDPGNETHGLSDADSQTKDCPQKGKRISAAYRRAGYQVHMPGRKLLSIALRSMIGRKLNRDATARERFGKRLGRKQVTTCTAGCKQHQRQGGTFCMVLL